MENGIIYNVHESNSKIDHCVYARAVSDKTVSWDFIVKDAAENTTYGESEIRGTFDEVMKVVQKYCGMGLSCQVGDGWLYFYPHVDCTMKDYIDENGIPVRVTPEMLICTPDNATAKIKCRVAPSYQRQFNLNAHYHKL